MKFLKKSLLFILSFIITIPAGTVIAIDEATLDFFDQNNIYYYNPSGTPKSYCNSSSNDCYIIGDTYDERLWSGIRHLGFTPGQTAAIISNIHHEGSTPATQEYAYVYARDAGCLTQEGNPYTIWTWNNEHHTSCMENIFSTYRAGTHVAGIGLGLVGWTAKNRREGYLEKMRELGLMKYFEGDAYKTYAKLSDSQLKAKIIEETGSETEYWLLWCAALQYIKKEFDQSYTDFYKMPDNSTDAAGALAGWMARNYERCATCMKDTDDGYISRIQEGKNIYEKYQNGVFDAVENGTAQNLTATATNGSNITMIGDSITVGAEAEIKKLLPNIDIHAQVSKHFSADVTDNPSGLSIVNDLISSNQLRSTVIIALGTNDTNISSSIKTMIETIGQSRSIFFVTNYDNADAEKYKINNSAITSAAAEYTNVHIIDWVTAVQSAKASNPSVDYIVTEQNYSVHPTNTGKTLFAKTIYSAFTSTSQSTNPCVTTNIASVADALPYLQQFIIDTNKLYNQSYSVPTSANLNQPISSPGSDPAVSANSSVLSSWKDQGLITENDYDISGSCWGGTYCGQCTALSGWFVTMMTNYIYNSGAGGKVVSKMLLANPDAVVSNTPSAFSVFSRSSGSKHGHTGIVLGELPDGKYLTIENNMKINNDEGYHLEVRTVTLSSFKSNNATFINLSNKLKLNHLGETYE